METIKAADQWTLSSTQSSEKSYLNVLLTPSEERWEVGTSEITKYFKEAVGEIPGAESLSFDIESHLEDQLV